MKDSREAGRGGNDRRAVRKALAGRGAGCTPFGNGKGDFSVSFGYSKHEGSNYPRVPSVSDAVNSTCTGSSVGSGRLGKGVVRNRPPYETLGHSVS